MAAILWVDIAVGVKPPEAIVGHVRIGGERAVGRDGNPGVGLARQALPTFLDIFRGIQIGLAVERVSSGH